MGGTYFSVTVDLPEPEAERCEDVMHELGATGLEVRESRTPAMPGVRAPAEGEAIIVAYFESREDAEAALSAAWGMTGARATLSEEPLVDWSKAWKTRIRSTQVGRLWVGPPWEEPPADKVAITIEPKMAFGTGDHPTTALCLGAIDAFIAAHPGASVLDVGTGTAVLAIAAKKLGAGRVVGVDNDPVSVELARENAALNGTPELDLSLRPLEAIDGPFDLVLANILANTLIELAPAIAAKVGKQLCLAGVLAHQAEEVTRAYVALGMRRTELAQQGDWVRIDLVPGVSG